MLSIIEHKFYLLTSINDVGELYSSIEINDKNLLLIVPGVLNDDNSEDFYKSLILDTIKLHEAQDWLVVFIRNNSHGILSDLLEATSGKLLGDMTENLINEAPEYPSRIIHALLNLRISDRKTAILCHSQGAIIACNAINCCPDRIKPALQLFSFGGASWTLPKKLHKPNVYVITTKSDLVSLFFGRYFCKSTIKLKNRKGHASETYIKVMKLSINYIFNNITKELFEDMLKNV